MGSGSHRQSDMASGRSGHVLVFGPFEFDPTPKLLYRGEKEVLLPPRAAAVLEEFLLRPGEVISKDELLEGVWKGAFVGEDSLSQALSIVRHALDDDPQDPTYIETKRKRGYRFIATVEERPRAEQTTRVQGAKDASSADVVPARKVDSTGGETETGGEPEASLEPEPGREPEPGVEARAPAADWATSGPAVGQRLGHFEILGELGAGAMGIVYRARDTVLERDVAIKVLPQDLLADRARLANLESEAKLLASVSHPNVAHVYSLAEIDGVKFPVLELVEGETLADRLSTAGMSVREALEVCRQVAAGLEAAHARGIVHRDLKPANIKVTPEGQVKVLDFGLAMCLDVQVFEGKVSESPTQNISIGGSYRGAIVGTVAYMSPEQARGRESDKRADIWSFGCVMYEVLTGVQPFERDTVAATLRAVIEGEPDWAALPPTTPPLVRSVVRRCLQKDPERRLRDIADARLEIEEALDDSAGAEASRVSAHVEVAFWRRALPWSVAVFAVAMALWSYFLAPLPETPDVASLLVEVQPGLYLTGGHPQEELSWGFLRPSRTAVIVSPDGRHLAYAATDGDTRQLYLRELSRQQAMPISGTEAGSSPFFSPDGRWIGFYASGALKKIPRSGGEPQTIVANVPPLYGASWADSDTIVFAADKLGGLMRVSAGGGDPEPVTTLDRGESVRTHRLPHVLPGGEAVLFTVLSDMDPTTARVEVASLETGARTVLIEEASDARFIPTGQLVFARNGTLMAAPFDLERLELTGEPVPVVENVMQASGGASTALDTGAAQFSTSGSGTLVYVLGGIYPEPQRSLVLVDEDGDVEALPLPANGYSAPRLSPDGRDIAYVVGRRSRRDVWIYDSIRETPRRLTFGESSAGAVWSPDGASLVLGDDSRADVFNLYRMPTDRSGDPQPLTTSARHQFVSSWSSEGVLAFVEGRHDIWVLPLEGDLGPRPFLESPFSEQAPAFSPNGAWLAYSSNETGRDEIYVRPYPGPDPVVRISTDGGLSPAWSRDGAKLYYRDGDRMMVVEVSAGRTFTQAQPRLLFESPSYLATTPTRAYDVTPDGRFLMVTRAQQAPQPATRINVVLNWFEELRERVPGGR